MESEMMVDPTEVEEMVDDGDEQMDDVEDDDEVSFDPISPAEMAGQVIETRRLPVPPHRLTPLKQSWMKIYQPVVEHLKLQIRFNPKRRAVELRTSQHTTEPGAIQKGEDFVRAFLLGFSIEDAVALLRIEDLYIDSFEIADVKTLEGEHLARAIGRIAGKDGMTKFTVENSTRTRIVLADRKVHILGSFANIKIARDAIVDLIRGSPASKVYGKLRTISARANERL